MKNRIPYILLALMLFACTIPTIPTQPAATLPPVPTTPPGPTSPPEPTNTIVPTEPPGVVANVTCNELSFYLDPTLASGYNCETIPATTEGIGHRPPVHQPYLAGVCPLR